MSIESRLSDAAIVGREAGVALGVARRRVWRVLGGREGAVDELDAVAVGVGNEADPVLLAGIGPAHPEVEHNVDRRDAIGQAIAGARRGDVVVIAGKGHEQGQEFAGGRQVAFDDATVAREVLRGAALAR